MEEITLRELVACTGGKLIGPYRDEDTKITGVSSDNRKIREGDVFFAYVGEKTDGHQYVQAALDAGACGCVIAKDPGEYREGKFYLLVQDTIRAVGDLAGYYRSKFDLTVIAVTGSVGKTTTKDMIASVLATRYQVLKTEGNFNNHIGVPRTLLQITGQTEVAVVEMGMNHLGEIDALSRMANPQIAVITNIGEAHIGNLGSRENIFRAKCEIFHGLAEGGLAVLNGDDDYMPSLSVFHLATKEMSPEEEAERDKREEEIAQMIGRESAAKLSRADLVFVGEKEDCLYRAEEIDDGSPDQMSYIAKTPEGTYEVEVPCGGRHMIYPTLASAAVASCFGLSAAEIQEGISAYVPAQMRMETVHTANGNTIYNDTYNANPQSMKAGLLTLSHTKADKRIAVLGDMFELGEQEERLHREIGAFVASLPEIDVLLAVGRASAWMAEEAKKCGMAEVYVCADKDEAKKVLQKFTARNTAFLVKASRGMALEELTEFLQNETQK